MFLLNHQRRFLFVNRAWEELTGLGAAAVHGLLCIRRAMVSGDPWDLVVRSLCNPPPEVLAGRPGRVCRPVPGGDAARRRWDLEFFSLHGENRLLCVLGKITPVILDETVAGAPLPAKLLSLRERLVQWHNLQLPAEVPSLRRLAEQIRLASQTRAPVLIVGERGTGKQWLARAIHYQGLGRERDFMAINCAALPAKVLAEYLFAESGPRHWVTIGTLYLRKPARLPRNLQARLVEWLAEQDNGRPRLLAGSSTMPAQDVKAGLLLEELYCVLAPLVFELAPLRDRPAELPWFVERFLERASAGAGHPVTGLTPEARALVHAYAWPGNLRELATVLAGAVARSSGGLLHAGDLPVHLRLALAADSQSDKPLALDDLLEKVERH